jgi:hypothetical protein
MPDLVVMIVGARPNFMKAAPVPPGLRGERIPAPDHPYRATLTNPRCRKAFFDELAMPVPAEYLGVGSASHAVALVAAKMQIPVANTEAG